ncbi:MAG: hypothetical protein AAF196_10175 [Planctomycetota bacterium]
MADALEKLKKPTLAELDETWLPAAGKSHRDGESVKRRVHTAVNFMMSCGFSKSATKNALRGIDFSAAVERTRIPSGRVIVRWGPLNQNYGWFTVSGVTPDQVGLYAEAADRGIYRTTSNVVALKSRARSIKVSWDLRAAVKSIDVMATQIARAAERDSLRKKGASEADIEKARKAILKIGQVTRGGAPQYLAWISSSIKPV